MDEYWTGIDQPAKSTMRACCATCQSYNGVCQEVRVMLPNRTGEGPDLAAL
jgi:hypothetical protein